VALLVGGPEPIESRQIEAGTDELVHREAVDGSLHSWVRTGRFQQHRGALARVYAYAGPADPLS